MSEGGRARSGATLAGVSVVSDAGFGATIIATASSVAALAELCSSSSEEDMVTGQPKTCVIINILV